MDLTHFEIRQGPETDNMKMTVRLNGINAHLNYCSLSVKQQCGSSTCVRCLWSSLSLCCSEIIIEVLPYRLHVLETFLKLLKPFLFLVIFQETKASRRWATRPVIPAGRPRRLGVWGEDLLRSFEHHTNGRFQRLCLSLRILNIQKAFWT